MRSTEHSNCHLSFVSEGIIKIEGEEKIRVYSKRKLGVKGEGERRGEKDTQNGGRE